MIGTVLECSARRVFLLAGALCVTGLCTGQVEAEVNFSEPRTIAIAKGAIAAGDLDGDGDPDVIASSGGLRWYENVDGLGTFGSEIEIGGITAIAVELADIDGDSDLDLVAAFQWSDRVSWFENRDGLGDFGPERFVVQGLDKPQSVAVADLDGNGTLDIVASTYNGDGVVWSPNGGAGTFGQALQVSGDVPWASGVETADMDGDSDIDVLSVSNLNGDVYWHENIDGAGTFADKTYIYDHPVANPAHVVAADLDFDGDQDLVSGASEFENGTFVAWHDNANGLGTEFESEIVQSAFNAGGAPTIRIADLDGDLDLDIVTAHSELGLLWYANRRDHFLPMFEDARTISDQLELRWVETADLDGDGDVDVLAASTDPNGLFWYENRSIDTSPILELSGSCPGELTLSFTDLTPDQDVVLFIAAGAGVTPLEEGKCAGIELNVSQPQRTLIARADLSGELTVSGNVPADACGAAVQAIDGDCRTSNVVEVPNGLAPSPNHRR